MSTAIDCIVPGARITRDYAEALLKDIPPAQFARIPKGVHTNHPAWVYGHLSVYPDRVLQFIGRPELAKPRADFDPLFENKTQPKDDPGQSIYPPMAEITGHYFDRTDAVIDALCSTPDSALDQPNPIEQMADRFPTVGAMTNFMLGAHSMMHLGQISTWRRVMGLGPCM
ncbi:MAG: DinB family protein [Phycisphaerales bacterium]|nr:MAG: DinB family protein [Phycisphaerales bacterium]